MSGGAGGGSRRQGALSDARWRQLQQKHQFGSTTNTGVLSEPSAGCCMRHGRAILSAVNVVFFVSGWVVLGVGIRAATSQYAALLTSGIGAALMTMGALLVVCPAVGEYGSRRDQKVWLTLYLLSVLAALVIFVVLGAIMAFDDGEYDARFSSLWCDFPEEAKKGETANDCCGYNCPLDRPAGGSGCPAGAVANASFTCDEAADQDLDNAAIRAHGKDACSDYDGAVKGCKAVALEKSKRSGVALGIVAFVFGLALLVGLATVCYLVCRRTGKGAAMTSSRGVRDAYKLQSLQNEHGAHGESVGPTGSAGPAGPKPEDGPSGGFVERPGALAFAGAAHADDIDDLLRPSHLG
jgi:Tetraspanin family